MCIPPRGAGHDAAHVSVEQGNGEGGVTAGSAPDHALGDQLALTINKCFPPAKGPANPNLRKRFTGSR